MLHVVESSLQEEAAHAAFGSHSRGGILMIGWLNVKWVR
jgi:hypothetical protein